MIIGEAVLSLYLAAAQSAWGVTISEPIHIRWEPLNDCRLGATPKDVAIIEVLDAQTTMRFDDGSQSEMTHTYTYVIKLNVDCSWEKTPLGLVITHEYGHILHGQAHSTNKRSVMYPVVSAGQVIMPEDRNPEISSASRP